MIAHVRGELTALGIDHAVVDCSGVGYKCLVPNSTRSRLPQVGEQVLLHTSFQVREDAMTLYGFLSREEFDLFELLLKVEGVGPKVALGVLSTTNPDGFRRAVALEDITALTRIPGVGKKTAQRMVIELKDKVGALEGGKVIGNVTAIPLPGAAGGEADPSLEALEALMALGYSRSDAAAALEKARKEAGEAPKTESLVRLGLKHLFRG